MKRYAVSILLAAALVVTAIPNANAAVTPGSKCSKAGTKQTYKNKTYTCIKLGSKLYWDNGKKIKKATNLLDLPATCTISVPDWRLFTNPRGTGGNVAYSALIINSSITNVAVNVRLNYEWYDQFGVSFRKIIEIPKIYPGAFPFGDIDHYEINGLNERERPSDVSVRSTCSSTPIKSDDLINGSFATLTGVSPIQIITDNSEVSNGAPPNYYGKASVLVTNIFKQKLKLEYPSQLKIFGVIKDKFGNTIGGHNGSITYGDAGSLVLYPGDSSRVMIDVLGGGGIELDDPSILNKFSVFEYVIVPDTD